jgi:hypothetical protein
MSLGANIRYEELFQDPYPIYKKLRNEEPVSFLNCINMWLVTRYDEFRYIEKNPELFSTGEGQSSELFGGDVSMRVGGDDHKRLRSAAELYFRPKEVKNRWSELIRKDAEELIERHYHHGKMDIVKDFAGPIAARSLKHLLGFDHVSDDKMQEWSQSFMDALPLFLASDETKARIAKTNKEIDEVMETEIDRQRNEPKETVLSTMVQHGLAVKEIRGNVKLMISGGLNEPRDAVSSAIWALMENPEQLELVKKDASLYKNVAEEAVRWLSPLCMITRVALADVTLNGVTIKKGGKIGISLSSINRDENIWKNPDKFDITREELQSQKAYGMGSHYCLGAWVARAQIMTSVPLIFERLKNLRFDENNPPHVQGFFFRGLTKCGIKWDV